MKQMWTKRPPNSLLNSNLPQSLAFIVSLFTNCTWWKSPESLYHDRKGGKMPFQPNVVILKGRAIGCSLPQTMVHIFSQRGSLMCEQGSGRAVNRSLYEGGIRPSMEGTKPCRTCAHTQAWPVCFDGSTRPAWLQALFTLDVSGRGQFPLDKKKLRWPDVLFLLIYLFLN